MASGATPFSWMSQAIRLVMTRVLPEPAPARISRGPSVASTAARCSGFNLAMSDCDTSGVRREGSFSSLNGERLLRLGQVRHGAWTAYRSTIRGSRTRTGRIRSDIDHTDFRPKTGTLLPNTALI